METVIIIQLTYYVFNYKLLLKQLHEIQKSNLQRLTRLILINTILPKSMTINKVAIYRFCVFFAYKAK